MTQGLNYVIFDTEAGWMGVLGSTAGLLRCSLPQRSAEEAKKLLGDSLNYTTPAPHLFDGLVRRFRDYFVGKKITFPDRLDLSGATAFQRKVWEVTRLIPYGETRSYGWVAGQIQKPDAARAVGQALGRNPLPVIVPCHRVLAGDGELCGFGGGLDMKRHLLRLEAVADIR